MARIKGIVPFIFSGKLGDLIFRRLNDQTVVSQAPRRTASRSDKQKLRTKKFEKASVYAKAVLTDKAIKKYYSSKAKPGRTAYNMAIADFMKSPVIGEIDLIKYSGRAGSIITVKVTDNFKVAGVKVKIENGEGLVVEEGDAVMKRGRGQWKYTATRSVEPVQGCVVTISARDAPGNVSVKRKIWA